MTREELDLDSPLGTVELVARSLDDIAAVKGFARSVNPVQWAESNAQMLRDAIESLRALGDIEPRPEQANRCTVCRYDYPTTGQQAGPVWSAWGPGYRICRWCVQAGRDERRNRERASALSVAPAKEPRRAPDPDRERRLRLCRQRLKTYALDPDDKFVVDEPPVMRFYSEDVAFLLNELALFVAPAKDQP